MAPSLKVFLFLAVAIACVFAAEEAERVKKQIFYSGYGYPYASAYAAPAVVSSAYAAPAVAAPAVAAPLAYSAGYSAYPYAAYRSIYY